jgi:hypothetical protein
MEQPHVVGLSPFLTTYAQGHHLPYHLRAYELLSEVTQTAYVGQEDSVESKKWFSPKFPRKMSKPKPSIKQKKFNTILKSVSSARTSFFIYEGSLYWIILAIRYMQGNINSTFIVNLFDSKVTTLRLTGTFRIFWIAFYKFIIKYSRGRLILSADNKKYFKVIKSALGENGTAYLPLFPSVKAIGKPNLVKNEKILISIRGPEGKKFLRKLAPLIRSSNQIIVHGLSREYVNEIGLPLAQISAQVPDFADYVQSSLQLSKCVLLYETGSYANQSSGRLIDFHEMGIKTIVPEGNALAEEFEKCPLIENFSYLDASKVGSFINDKQSQVKQICTCKSRSQQFQTSFSKVLAGNVQERVFARELNGPSSPLFTLIKIFLDFFAFLTSQGRFTWSNILDHCIQLFRMNHR